MGERKSYSVKRATGGTKGLSNIRQNLSEALKNEDPKKIALESVRLATSSSKNIKEFSDIIRAGILFTQPELKEKISKKEHEKLSQLFPKKSPKKLTEEERKVLSKVFSGRGKK